LQDRGLERGIAPMRRLGSDQNQGGDAIGCGNGRFERASSSDRAADDDQTVTSRQLERFGRPRFDAVAEGVERRRIGRTGQKVHRRAHIEPSNGRACNRRSSSRSRAAMKKFIPILAVDPINPSVESGGKKRGSGRPLASYLRARHRQTLVTRLVSTETAR
jgi:hypothetical protein